MYVCVCIYIHIYFTINKWIVFIINKLLICVALLPFLIIMWVDFDGLVDK
jgi:hypothetical protein